MRVFLTLLPLYIFGNLHCLGMCGPLVLMLGGHRHRNFYFLGRTLSFTFAGALAGGAGAVIQAHLSASRIGAAVSFLFGALILGFGAMTLFKVKFPFRPSQGGILQKISLHLSTLLLKDSPFAVFLFGFFTIFLPCGQTLIVYSALAIEGDFWSGTFNGAAFALMTSPALFFAMRAVNLLKAARQYYNAILGFSAMGIGAVVFRGLAEAGFISHLVLNPDAASEYHIVLF